MDRDTRHQHRGELVDDINEVSSPPASAMVPLAMGERIEASGCGGWGRVGRRLELAERRGLTALPLLTIMA
jgi:hypothetical protein